MYISNVLTSIDTAVDELLFPEQGETTYSTKKLAELQRRDCLSDTYFDYDGYSFCHAAEQSLLQRIEAWSRPTIDVYEDCLSN